MNVTLAPAFLEEESNVSTGIRLRTFQSQLRSCEDHAVILHVPTSGGKTLAYLLRAVDFHPAPIRYKHTIIIYPTNALLWDQAASLKSLLTDYMGRKVNLTVENHGEITWLSDNNDADVDLFVLNGETLSALAEEKNSSEGRAILNRINVSSRPRIILTNPEILYHMFLHRFAKNTDLLKAIFVEHGNRVIIFDEFHLYYGFSLANIAYFISFMRGYFDQMIFSSATPIDIGGLLGITCKEISATPSDRGAIIRHRTRLEIDGIKQIIGKDDFPGLVQLVRSYKEKVSDSNNRIKVLIILNSVVSCKQLAALLRKEFPDQVTEIHGLVPPRARPKVQTDFKPIVIGTSAIEVGVDFDTASLIFEAHDASSFLQRLGRGSRHGECITTALVPDVYLEKFNNVQGKVLSLSEFVATVRSSLPKLDAYEDFPKTRYAAPIMMAILLNLSRCTRHDARWSVHVRHLKNNLNNIAIPSPFSVLGEIIQNNLTSGKYDGADFNLAERISCRNSLDSIPSIFLEKDRAYFDYVSFYELPRLVFTKKRREEVKKMGHRIPWNMRIAEEFLVISGIKDEQERVRADVLLKEDRPRQINKITIHTSDDNLSRQIEDILRGNHGLLIPSKDDWRFTGVYTTKGYFLVVGGDAFLAQYVRDKRP